MPNPLFPLGQVVATPGVLEVLEKSKQTSELFLRRHLSGDWGDCNDADKAENELSVREGFRIVSVYHTRDGEKIWVITEADRSSTCILLPDEY